MVADRGPEGAALLSPRARTRCKAPAQNAKASAKQPRTATARAAAHRTATPRAKTSHPRAPREICVENARTHNLRGVSCAFPLGKFTAVSGPSGSGKSSLAFDTLYAEGQRRYLSSLSNHARQFLERLPRPEVERVTNLPPAVAVAQNFGHRAATRATVGSASEIASLLHLLFAHAGETRCCGERVCAGDLGAVTARVLKRFAGERVLVAAPGVLRAREKPSELRARLLRDGHHRLLLPDGALFDLTNCKLPTLRRALPDARLLIDRFEVTPKNKTRLAEALAEGFARGGGVLDVVTRARAPATGAHNFTRYRDHFACEHCGRRHPQPSPDLFSFDSPLGACASCQGFGRRAILDRALLVPDPARTLEGGALQPFRTRGKRRALNAMLAACAARGVATDVPWRELDARAQDFVINGEGKWRGVRGFFERLEKKRYKVQARVLLARYRGYERCEDCEGTRLTADARAVFLPAGALCTPLREQNGNTNAPPTHTQNPDAVDIGALSRRTLGELASWANALNFDAPARTRTARVLALLRARLATACEVGLGYLALERPLRTLSGGEAQRIALARALGGALSATLYVLDEPSVGLHPRDLRRLVTVLHGIRDGGNSVVVVEHAPEILAHADHIIDLGPGAGRDGGRVLAEGNVSQVRANAKSPTGRVLAGKVQLTRRARVEITGATKRSATRAMSQRDSRARGELKIRGARAHNLKNLNLRIPLGQLVLVTGVSGAGKSSLARAVLVDGLLAARAGGASALGTFDDITGAEVLRDVVVALRTPPARSLRSNAATVSKAFDGIRRAFAALPEARKQKRKEGWFSFNVAGGRCEACAGTGEIFVDMQFLEDLRAPCEHCAGTRYGEAARAFRLRGHSIASALQLSVDEAREVFADAPDVAARLEPYARAGLGYLSLAQPLSTLSGGELQRMRIAQALASEPSGALFVLDEPATGLHVSELQMLLTCFDELLAAGASVVVVEHNLHLIACADYILDLGPEGGPAGGQLVASGTPAQVAATEGSHTGAALRAFMQRAR